MILCVQNCCTDVNTEKCTHLTIRHGWRFGSNDGAIQPIFKPPARGKAEREREWERNDRWFIEFHLKIPGVCVCARVFVCVPLFWLHLLHSHFVSFKIRHAHIFFSNAKKVVWGVVKAVKILEIRAMRQWFFSLHNNDESDTHQRSNVLHVYRLINEYMQFGIEFGSACVFFLSLSSYYCNFFQKKSPLAVLCSCAQNTFHYYFFIRCLKKGNCTP